MPAFLLFHRTKKLNDVPNPLSISPSPRTFCLFSSRASMPVGPATIVARCCGRRGARLRPSWRAPAAIVARAVLRHLSTITARRRPLNRPGPRHNVAGGDNVDSRPYGAAARAGGMPRVFYGPARRMVTSRLCYCLWRGEGTLGWVKALWDVIEGVVCH